MRLALVTDTYAPRVGGIETQAAGLAHALREAGDDVVVVTATAGTAEAGVIRVPGVGGAVPNPLAHKDLRRALAGRDVVHVHVGVISPFAWMAVEEALALGLPTVVTVHSMLGPARHALAPLLRRWERRGVLLTAVSDAAARDVRRAGVARVAVLPNAIRLSDWPPVIAPGGAPRFVTTTRLVGRKRAVPLVRAFARADLPADARLVVIGDGPQRSLVQEAARRAGVADAVRLTGRLAPEQVRAEIPGPPVLWSHLSPVERGTSGIWLPVSAIPAADPTQSRGNPRLRSCPREFRVETRDNSLHIFLVSCLQMVLVFMTLVKKKPLMLLGI